MANSPDIEGRRSVASAVWAMVKVALLLAVQSNLLKLTRIVSERIDLLLAQERLRDDIELISAKGEFTLDEHGDIEFRDRDRPEDDSGDEKGWG